MTFLSGNFPFRKFQFYQSDLMYVPMATIQLFGIILKTQISIDFQVSPPEKNFLWDNRLSLGQHITLRSLIEANIKSVTVEKFQKIILPKYGYQH